MTILTVGHDDFNRLAKAKVISVHDGDTLTVAIMIKQIDLPDQDLGYHLHIESGWLTLHTAVRLYGINAPEMSTPEGKVSRDFLRKHLPAGTEITLKTAQNPTDKYGRWLGIVYLHRINLNIMMRKSGHATIYDV